MGPDTRLPPAQLQIGSRLLDQSSGGVHEQGNPAAGQVQARVPLAGVAEINEAVEAAKAGFAAWRNTAPRQRRDCLNRLADLIEQNADELIRLSCLENGTSLKGAF